MMYCELCEHWSLSCSTSRIIINSVVCDDVEELFDVRVRICDECVDNFEEKE